MAQQPAPPDVNIVAEVRGELAREVDIVVARRLGQKLLSGLHFSEAECMAIDIAILEIGNNVVQHAGQGEFTLSVLQKGNRSGLRVQIVDRGPGIVDIGLALQDGYSTGNSLGLGLPGARRLMDEFTVESQVGVGTSVTMEKWESNHEV